MSDDGVLRPRQPGDSIPYYGSIDDIQAAQIREALLPGWVAYRCYKPATGELVGWDIRRESPSDD